MFHLFSPRTTRLRSCPILFYYDDDDDDGVHADQVGVRAGPPPPSIAAFLPALLSPQLNPTERAAENSLDFPYDEFGGKKNVFSSWICCNVG